MWKGLLLSILLTALLPKAAQSQVPADYLFDPLDCNVNLASQPCESWTTLYSIAANQTAEVVIPCGRCVNMDLQGGNLVLSGGIDIQGKLVFQDGYRLTMRTPYVRVQGELHMSSTKTPNGNPDVKVILTGTSDSVPNFIPADNNVDACGGLCGVGKKPIVVAGGRLQIQALPPDFPSWLNLYDVIPTANPSMASALVLNNTVLNKWGVGAEVLITSHTLTWDQEQVRNITKISPHTESGYAVVELNAPILRPTTVKDSADFAVEVALLARNIVFEGAKDDPNTSHGGHLIFFGTPNVAQMLEGVEVRNFGQQGNLGRYPIHFHLCEENPNSVISKNLIRESNQRCIVVHGTHDTNVEWNVAYNTAGHCFMTEDGFEHGNTFRSNLGALTKKVMNIIPDNGQNGEETDDEPSTFWISSPTNSWISNVAAGGEDSGFWMEMRREVRGPMAHLYPDLEPRYEPLTLFEGNVAHSNQMKGMRTYPFGYDPIDEAQFVNCRAYRNDGDGIFFHNSHNLAIIGGVFADNREQIDLDNAEYVRVRDASVIGISPQMKNLMSTQDLDQSPCQVSKVVGVTLHTFTRMSAGNGAQLENVRFTGFVDTGCENAFAIEFDDEVRRGSFDYFSSLSQVSIEDGAVAVDLCEAKVNGVTDVYLVDKDNNLNGATATSRIVEGTSTVIGDGSSILSFVDQGNCQSFPQNCYTYCQNTCVRTVTYKVDPTIDPSVRLRVCRSGGQANCVEVSSTYYFEDHDEDSDQESLMKNSDADKPRFFSVHLPKGSYEAQFVDREGLVTWPTYVEEVYEDALCPEALEDGAVNLVAPTPEFFECTNLIRNGAAEVSPNNHTFWLHRRGGVYLAAGEGVDGSNAFGQLDSDNARTDSIVQYLDTRCFDLMKGRQYEIVAFVKLERNSGEAYTSICDPNEDDCPEIGFYLYSPEGSTYKEEEVATLVPSENSDGGYHMLRGILDVTENVASASRVMLYVERNVDGVVMFVDNVSMSLVRIPSDPVDEPPQTPDTPSDSSGSQPDSPETSSDSPGTTKDPTSFAPGDLSGCVYNGDFGTGDSSSWEDTSKEGLEVVSPGFFGTDDFALSSFEGGMEQSIDKGCIGLEKQYIVRAKFKLYDENNNEFACDPTTTDEDSWCPVMRLLLTSEGDESLRTVAYVARDSTNEGWYTMFGGFMADDAYAEADTIRLHFRNVPGNMTLVIDEVSITEYGTSTINSSASGQAASIFVLGTVLLLSLIQIF